MIDRDHEGLSLSRQCVLLGLSRSALYYTPVGQSAETLALMRRIDERYLRFPFYGSRRWRAIWRVRGCRSAATGVRRLMRLLGLEAIYRPRRRRFSSMAASSLRASACCSRHWAVRRFILSGNGSPSSTGTSAPT